jgi:hypothetical protein
VRLIDANAKRNYKKKSLRGSLDAAKGKEGKEERNGGSLMMLPSVAERLG